LGSNEQGPEVWDFFVCPEKTKWQDESPWAGDFLTLRSKQREGDVGGANSRCLPQLSQALKTG